jgi:hypothetical protein
VRGARRSVPTLARLQYAINRGAADLESPCDPRHRWQRDGTGCQMQEMSSVGKFHGNPFAQRPRKRPVGKSQAGLFFASANLYWLMPSTMNESESVDLRRIASNSFVAAELCQACAFSGLSN